MGISAVLICAASAMADEGTGQDFEVLLQDATEMVSTSKLNIDYSPSVISVLNHTQLKLLGTKTLFEALALLPGVETSVNQLGVKKVIFRGFDNPNNFIFDKAKLIVDGVEIEMGIYGNSSFYFDLPVDVIERIEVLRGPGSALYGTGAFNGVINVVTKELQKHDNALFMSVGSHNYRLGGIRADYAPDADTQLHVDLYYQRHDRMIEAGEAYGPINILDLQQTMATGDPVYLDFPREYTSNEAMQDYSIGVTLNHGVWTFRTRLKEDTNGNYFGWDERLEMGSDYDNTQRYIFAELAYTDTVAEKTAVTAKAGYSHYRLVMDGQNYVEAVDVGLVGWDQIWIPYEYAIYNKEDRIWAEAFVDTKVVADHEITAGLLFKTMRENENWLSDSISPYGRRPLYEEDLTRDTYAVYVRDTVALASTVRLLAALRLDYDSHTEKSYPSAQAGLVYMPARAWHFKLNYGHAFRIPSWVEQYTIDHGAGDGVRPGNPGLEAETTDTIEAVVIWRRGTAHHLQGNLYYSVLHDVIDIEEHSELYGYSNHDNRDSYGAEFAYTYTSAQQNQLHLNLSFNETSYTGPIFGGEQSMPGVAQFMAKGYYIYYLTPSATLSALVKHIGKRTRNEDFDYRKVQDRGYDAYTTVDLTFGLATSTGWEFQASVKNLFDEAIAYPSYYLGHVEGIPRDGRNWLVQAEYAF